MARSSWSDSGLRENPNASYNKGPYDSGVYQGIDRSIIYNHEDGYTDDESKMNSYIESAFFDIEDGDLSMFADRFAPDFRSLGSTASPELTAVLTAKNYPSSSASKTRSLALTESTEFVNTRLRGRTMSIKFNDNEGPSNAGWELGDSRIRIKPDGRR